MDSAEYNIEPKRRFNIIDFFKNLSPIIILLLFIAYFAYKKKSILSNPVYTYGKIEGITKGVRGSYTLDYYFTVGSKKVEGFVTTDFCEGCNHCCVPGQPVIVRYEKWDITNNDLLHELPKGAVITQ